MIKRLKRKFILLSAASLVILLTVILVGMNLVNYHLIVKEADEILQLLSQNEGTFPGIGDLPSDLPTLPPATETGNSSGSTSSDGLDSSLLSGETPYESRYFSVLLDKSGTVQKIDRRHIASISEEDAISYAQQAFEHEAKRGFIGNFRYTTTTTADTVRITFLSWEQKVHTFFGFLYAGVAISLFGFALLFAAICFFSERIVRPIAVAYEKQKRFITDAGHEIKTPLTIINANVDLLEMEIDDENESLADIRQQTRRLTDLTNDLVYLSRMQEAELPPDMIEFPISEVAQETVESFKALAVSSSQHIVSNIAPLLSLHGNDKALRQLISILMDNALKYSPRGGIVYVDLTKQSRAIQLSVRNTTLYPIGENDLEHIFDRFYRPDPSRNSGTGGHGIGLSVAHAIVTAHGGKIVAAVSDTNMFHITVTLPL